MNRFLRPTRTPSVHSAPRFALLLLVLLVVAACGAPAAQTPAATEAPAADGPRRGGTVTIAVAADVGTMDPQGGIGISAAPLYAAYEPLLKVSREVELIPGLAESWEVVDPTTYRYRLRQGVTFHSGNPFNAEAVKADIERFQTPGVAARDYNLFSMIDRVEVEDEYTVLFRLNRPFPAFPYHTAEILSLVVDAARANEIGDAAFSEQPSGTGPFMLESWAKNDRLTLTRNPNYWDGDKPYLDQIVYRVIPDEATRSVALEAGEVDIVLGVSPAEVERLRSNPDIKIDEQTISRSVYLGFPYDTAPFTDLAVRQALAAAINVDSIVDFVQEGTVEKATTFYPPLIFGSAEGSIAAAPAYNLEQAQALLDEAGWAPGADGIREKDGERLSFTLTFPSAVLPAMRQTAEVIQQNLREAGIEVNLDEREWAAFVGDWIEKKVELYIMGISATTGSLDVSFPNQWLTDGSWNASRYSNPAIDAGFAEASQIIDDAERRTKYQELQQILAADVAAVPLFHMRTYVAMRQPVQGFANHPLEHSWPTEIWLSE
jgi:peptide/nickel transport system substrate-binding protein